MRISIRLAFAACVAIAVLAVGLPEGSPSVLAAPVTGIAAVSVGGAQSCALTTRGAVKCWGHSVTAPADVSGLTSGVTAVSVGGEVPSAALACVVTTSGGVKCWGSNHAGELGNGTTTGSDTPVDVSGLTGGVAAVSAGDGYACALTTSGGVKCWGANSVGQLGNGMSTGPQICSGLGCSTTPVDVAGLTSGVAAISAGSGHTCALTTSGGVKCWGANGVGQLGNGTNTGPQICVGLGCSTTPVDVSGLTAGVTAVSTGAGHTCALTTAGGVKCWGSNGSGELGDGGFTAPKQPNATPVDVSGLTTGVAVVSAGGGHTCALTTAGGVKCWGDNTYGELGNGISGGPEACFEGAPCSTTAVDVTGLPGGVVAISAAVGGGHTCALTTSSGVKCWGYNYFGQLGDGTTTNRSAPVDVVVTPPYPVGDVNCDSVVNAVDAALVLQYDARLTTSLPCSQNADVNHDGQVNSLDALLILQYGAGLITSLPT